MGTLIWHPNTSIKVWSDIQSYVYNRLPITHDIQPLEHMQHLISNNIEEKSINNIMKSDNNQR